MFISKKSSFIKIVIISAETIIKIMSNVLFFIFYISINIRKCVKYAFSIKRG
jgi:hypothetical protein